MGIIILFSCNFSWAALREQGSQIHTNKITKFADLNPELYPTDIPNYVHYSPPPESDCLFAKELLEKALQKNREKNVGLFKKAVAIGHSLWSELKSEEPYKSDPGPPVISFEDGVKLEGKGLKSNESMNSLERYLREKLNTDGPVIVRPPNREELIEYWAVIAWDINSPLFVAESSNSKIIFQFIDGHAGNVVLLK